MSSLNYLKVNLILSIFSKLYIIYNITVYPNQLFIKANSLKNFVLLSTRFTCLHLSQVLPRKVTPVFSVTRENYIFAFRITFLLTFFVKACSSMAFEQRNFKSKNNMKIWWHIKLVWTFFRCA